MKSFLEGRQAVARQGGLANLTDSRFPSFGERPADPNTPALTGHSPAPQREHGERKIETVEVAGVIQKIIVTCSCGERIEVHCGY